MLRSVLSLLVALVAAPAFAADAKVSAFDKATLETYVRHLFVLTPQVKVEILNPEPADLPGMKKVTVRLSSGPAKQDMMFYVTADGQKLVQANVWEIGSNPFKKDLDKLKTEFQPNFGTPGATVVIVLFSDFECPYCKEEALTLRKNLLSAYPTQVRVYFKDYPLDQIHKWARPAAIAGRCVFQQAPAEFWSYHDWMYEHQAEVNEINFRDKVQEWAKGSKDVDALQLGRCVEKQETAAEVDKSVAEARALNINSTPTLFVNGRMINERIDWPNLRNIIDNEIEYQKTAKNAGEDCGCEMKINMPGAPRTGAPTLKR